MQTLDFSQTAENERGGIALARLERLLPGENLTLIMAEQPNKLLRLLATEMPCRLLWAPLENGPGCWRRTIVIRDAASPATISEYLGWDHRRLESLLAEGMAFAGTGDWQQAQTRIQEYATGLHHHADVEDAILFPAYHRATGNLPDGPTAHMISEHREVRAGLDALTHAAGRTSLNELEQAYQRLADLLLEHHTKEEEILFPAIDEILTPAQCSDLVEAMLLA